MSTPATATRTAAPVLCQRGLPLGDPAAPGLWPFVLGSLLLGTIGVFVQEAHAHPLTATWFRCAFGLLGLSAWVALNRQVPQLRLTRATGGWVVAAGALMVLSWVLFFAAIGRTGAGVATMVFHVSPLWVLLFGTLLLKEAVGRRRLTAVSAAMVGLLLATGLLQRAGAPAQGAGYWRAVAFCVAGSLCMAGVTIAARKLRDMPAGVLAWWQCLIGTLVLWVWPMTDGWPALGAPWLWLAGLGLIHTGLAYSLLYAGMARLSTERIAVLQFIYPAVALLIDWAVYGHRLGGLQLIGIAVMALAIWAAERPSAPR